MKRLVLHIGVAVFLSLGCLALAQSPAPQKPAAKPKAAPVQGAARFLIPGAGAVGKGAPRTANPLSLFGPPNPTAPIRLPAQVGPGSGALPGLGMGRALPGGLLEARPVTPMFYGLNVVWSETGSLKGWDADVQLRASRLAALVKDLRVTSLRIRLNWAEIEKKRGAYDWTEADRFVKFVSGLGPTLICVVEGAPDWALDRSQAVTKLLRDRQLESMSNLRAPEKPFVRDFSRFAKAVSGRYTRQIRQWECWSDPDGIGMPVIVRDATGKATDVRFGADPKAYAELLVAFTSGIRQSDSDAKVAIGGLQVQNLEFLSWVYRNAGRKAFDAVALHPTCDRKGVNVAWLDQIDALMDRMGDRDKPVWVTEWGWSTDPARQNSVPPLEQARLIREGFAALRARPYVAVSAYGSLNDWRTGANDGENLIATGLVQRDLTSKPAYAAFRAQVQGATQAGGTRLTRISLIGALPDQDQDGLSVATAEVQVSFDKPAPGASNPWLGFSVQPGTAARFKEARDLLGASGASTVRFDPLPDPEMVKLRPGVGGQEASEFVIDWSYADSMVENCLIAGRPPIFNIATMPLALAAGPGRSRMPRDIEQWSRFVAAIVRRYNVDQGRGIKLWELSNEPNDGSIALADWLKLYDAFAKAVLAVDPTVHVGGPATAQVGMNWIAALVDHCGELGTPLHFISWHAYSIGAGEVRETASAVRKLLAKYAKLANLSLILSEWNYSAAPSPVHDGQYGAVYLLSRLEEMADIPGLQALVYDFRDMRRPSAQGTPLWGGWGVLAHDTTPKPSYHALRAFAQLKGSMRLAGSADQAVRVLASKSREELSCLVWRAPEEASEESLDRPVLLKLTGLPATPVQAKLRIYPGDQEYWLFLPGGDVEVPAVLAPNGFALLTGNTVTVPTVHVQAGTANYVNYSGAPFALAVTAKNLLSRPQKMRIQVYGPDPKLPAGQDHVLAANETRSIAFALRGPSEMSDEPQRYRVFAGGSMTSVSVRFAPPVAVTLSPHQVDLLLPFFTEGGPDGVAQFAAELENKSNATVNVKLGDNAGPQTDVPRRSKIVLPVRVSAPANVPGNYRVPVKVSVGSEVVGVVNVGIGVPAVARFTPRPPKLDGELSEWTGVTAMASEVQDQSTGGGRGSSGHMIALWDEEFLYLAAHVLDDVADQPFTAWEAEKGDSLAVLFDTQRSARKVDSPVLDYEELLLCPLRAGPSAVRSKGASRPSADARIRVAVRRVGARAIYEAAIPWDCIAGTRPKPGLLIGFSWRLNDKDGERFQSVTYPDPTVQMGQGMVGIGLRLVR